MAHESPTTVNDQSVPQMSIRNLVTLFVWAVALALFFYFFGPFTLLFLGVLAAGCLAAALYPLVRYLPISRGFSAVIVGVFPALVAVGLVALLSWLFASSIRQQFQQWPQVRQDLNNTLANWSQKLGLEQSVDVQGLLSRASSFITDAGGPGVISTTTDAISAMAVALAFVFFGSIYFMADSPSRLLTPVVEAMPPRRGQQVRDALDDLVPRLRWWVIGTLFSMVVVGLLAWAGYAIVGLSFALSLALLVGLAEIVPTVGPAIAFLVAALFASTQGMGILIGVVVVYVLIQLVESYVLLPLVMKKAVRMPPVITLFTVVLWGKVFGIAGLLLAIPINLTLWSFYDHLVLRPRRQAAAAP